MSKRAFDAGVEYERRRVANALRRRGEALRDESKYPDDGLEDLCREVRRLRNERKQGTKL